MTKATDSEQKLPEKEWFFYIVRCCDDSLYSGITDNLDKRLKAHNSGKGAKYTASHRPVSLVFFEKRTDISDARKREAEVKSWQRNKKEALIEGIIS
jgi:predicted GIY-YIG superfamily endonuclease